jgi:hypothetical protein
MFICSLLNILVLGSSFDFEISSMRMHRIFPNAGGFGFMETYCSYLLSTAPEDQLALSDYLEWSHAVRH